MDYYVAITNEYNIIVDYFESQTYTGSRTVFLLSFIQAYDAYNDYIWILSGRPFRGSYNGSGMSAPYYTVSTDGKSSYIHSVWLKGLEASNTKTLTATVNSSIYYIPLEV